jgi:hypothetical protein
MDQDGRVGHSDPAPSSVVGRAILTVQLQWLLVSLGTIQACPLRVGLSPDSGRSGASASRSEKGHKQTSSSKRIGLWDSRESRLRPSGATKPYILSIITLRCRFSTSLNLSNFGAFFSSPRAFLTKFRLSVADNGRIVRIETAAHASHEFISASYSCR